MDTVKLQSLRITWDTALRPQMMMLWSDFGMKSLRVTRIYIVGGSKNERKRSGSGK